MLINLNMLSVQLAISSFSNIQIVLSHSIIIRISYLDFFLFDFSVYFPPFVVSALFCATRRISSLRSLPKEIRIVVINYRESDE